MSQKQNGFIFCLLWNCVVQLRDMNLYYYWPYGVSLSQV